MPIDVERVLKHVKGFSLEAVEAELALLNLSSQRSTEVFSVNFVRGQWYAHFLISAPVFNDYLRKKQLVQSPTKKKRGRPKKNGTTPAKK